MSTRHASLCWTCTWRHLFEYTPKAASIAQASPAYTARLTLVDGSARTSFVLQISTSLGHLRSSKAFTWMGTRVNVAFTWTSNCHQTQHIKCWVRSARRSQRCPITTHLHFESIVRQHDWGSSALPKGCARAHVRIWGIYSLSRHHAEILKRNMLDLPLMFEFEFAEYGFSVEI